MKRFKFVTEKYIISIHHQCTNFARRPKPTPMNPVNYGISSRKSLGEVLSRPSYILPPRMNTRYAPRKRWICESQGWIMVDAVHRCKRGVVRRSGAWWLGRICETIIESARAHALEGRRRCRPRMGISRNNPPYCCSLRRFMPNEFRTTI